MTIRERDRLDLITKMVEACENSKLSLYSPHWVVIRIRAKNIKGRHWLYYDKPDFMAKGNKIVFRTSKASYSMLATET